MLHDLVVQHIRIFSLCEAVLIVWASVSMVAAVFAGYLFI